MNQIVQVYSELFAGGSPYTFSLHLQEALTDNESRTGGFLFQLNINTTVVKYSDPLCKLVKK